MARTEREKMMAGELYIAADPELIAMRDRCRGLLHEFNHAHPDDREAGPAAIRRLFGAIGGNFEIVPTFHCDYGSNIHAGDGFMANANCVILDVGEVRIGNNVLFGPAVQIYTAGHPLEADIRAAGPEFGLPITIGDRVWLGGGVIVLPGVTIGGNTVVGAGSVVTRDLPEDVLAVGNPCRVVRKIAE